MLRALERGAVEGSRNHRWMPRERFQSSWEQTLMVLFSDNCHTWGRRERRLRKGPRPQRPGRKASASRTTHRLASQEAEDAQPLVPDEDVRLKLVPVGQLQGQQLPDLLAAHQLGEQQRQAEVPCNGREPSASQAATLAPAASAAAPGQAGLGTSPRRWEP